MKKSPSKGRQSSPRTRASASLPENKTSSSSSASSSSSLVVEGVEAVPSEAVVLDENCAICRDSLTGHAVGTISCGHEFCVDCIQQWSARENSCPLCKQRFTSIKRKEIEGTEDSESGKKRKTKNSRQNVIRVRSRNQEPPGMADLNHTMAIVHRLMREHGFDAFNALPQPRLFPRMPLGVGISLGHLMGNFAAAPRIPYVPGEVINLVDEPVRRTVRFSLSSEVIDLTAESSSASTRRRLRGE